MANALKHLLLSTPYCNQELSCSLSDLVMIVQVSDMALEDYIAVKPKFARYVPHTAGRYQKKRFRKAQCPIVER